MSMTAPSPTSSFDVLSGHVEDRLLAAAASASTRAAEDPAHGVLVIVARPGSDDHRVISGGGSGVLRAAVSVAVGAGNDRLWRDAPEHDTDERSVRSMPEVVSAAADADGVRAVHVGAVRVDGAVESLAIWFETWHGVASQDERSEILVRLAAAGAAERERRAEIAAAAPKVVEIVVEEGPEARTFDANDPDLDAVTGLLTAEKFDEVAFDYERDEALLVLIDLDGFAAVQDEYGAAVSDGVVREIADRLVGNIRGGDIIARLDHDRFAILFGAVDRREAVHISRRLLGVVAEPLPAELGPEAVTGTVALAHQVGLVDIEEMLESAVDALASSKRAGAGRLVLAA